MPRKPPPLFPQEQRRLFALGERRRLSNVVVAGRVGIWRDCGLDLRIADFTDLV